MEKGGENLEESTKKMLKRNCNMVTLTANQMVLAQTQEDCCFTKKIFMRHDSLGLLRPVSFFVISHLVDSNRTQSHHREVPRWEISMEQELRFGLVWQLMRPVFSCFHRQIYFF